MERRADPLAAQREAVARAVAAEEHAVLGGRAQAVREPVALPALGVGAEPLRQVLGRLAHVVARLVGADADALLLARRHAPGEAARGTSERSTQTSSASSPPLAWGWTSRPRLSGASGGW